jgi:amidase
VKDNIAVAGIPMTNGKRHLSVVPAEDAVVVERLLDAGATIVAKANLYHSDFGLTRNPRDPRFFAGGSSSGSAAAVASGTVELALGADQGGSIRTPAAWCGLVGMKATHGLVPSYGSVYWDHTLDYVGPMTATVEQNAAMLEVIAGGDWRDPQWVRADPVAGRYVRGLDGGVRGLRVGVVTESLENCTPAAAAAFAHATEQLKRRGADVVSVSVPLWSASRRIWMAVLTHGMTGMWASLGQGFGHLGRANPDLVAAAAQQAALDRQDRRASALAYEHLRQACLGAPLARVQNLRLELRRQVDGLFDGVDLLVTPTTVTGPPELELADSSGSDRRVAEEVLRRIITNTAALNLTGHPALTVPFSTVEHDLPAGVQVIGRRFDEQSVYRAGFALAG